MTIAKPAIFHDFLKLEVDLEFLDQVFKIRAHLSVSVCNGQCCDNSTTGTSSCSGGDHKIKQSLCCHSAEELAPWLLYVCIQNLAALSSLLSRCNLHYRELNHSQRKL